MPLPNAEETTLLNHANLYLLAGVKELERLAPPPLFSCLRASCSSQPSSLSDYTGLPTTL